MWVSLTEIYGVYLLIQAPISYIYIRNTSAGDSTRQNSYMINDK